MLQDRQGHRDIEAPLELAAIHARDEERLANVRKVLVEAAIKGAEEGGALPGPGGSSPPKGRA